MYFGQWDIINPVSQWRTSRSQVFWNIPIVMILTGKGCADFLKIAWLMKETLLKKWSFYLRGLRLLLHLIILTWTLHKHWNVASAPPLGPCLMFIWFCTLFLKNYWSQTAVLDCGACGEKYHKSKRVDCLQIARLLIIFFSGNLNSMLLFYLKRLIWWRTKRKSSNNFSKNETLGDT